MNVYESFGIFDPTTKEYDLAVQTTLLKEDFFTTLDCYDISNPNGCLFLLILETAAKDDTDFSGSPANSATIFANRSFHSLIRKFYQQGTDKDVFSSGKSDVIHVIVHHAIGFNPSSGSPDETILTDYKAKGHAIAKFATANGTKVATFADYQKAFAQFPVAPVPSPPARSGNGLLIGR